MKQETRDELDAHMVTVLELINSASWRALNTAVADLQGIVHQILQEEDDEYRR